MSEPDGIEEPFEGLMHQAVTSAGRIGERMALARADAQRAAAAASLAEQRDLQARVEAERASVRAELAATRAPGWWEQASGEQIAHAWQGATAWAGQDPVVEFARRSLSEQLRQRYGLDTATTPVNAATVDAGNRPAAQHPQEQKQGRERAEASDVSDRAERAERADRAQRAESDQPRGERASAKPAWNSAERRAATEAEMTQAGVRKQLVAAAMRVDASRAFPRSEATKVSGRGGERPRPTRGTGVEIERSEQER